MSRRSRAATARAAQARAGQATGAAAPRSASPFAALAALRNDRQEPTGAGTGDSTRRARNGRPPAPGRPAGNAQHIGAEDLALFHKANAGARPLRPDGRCEIERPRPEPLPRRKTAAGDEPEPEHRRAPIDPLQAAYEDVTPLRDTGRVELDTLARHRARVADTHREDGPGTNAAELPPAIDLNDPEALFRHAMRGTQPLEIRNRVHLEGPAPAPAPIKREADEQAALGESLSAPLSFEDRLDMGDEAAFLRPGLPRRVLNDLRRGRWVLQGQIDLHGLTRDEAREALGHFLTASLQQGRRCVRVIHGKGLGSPGRISVLKQLSRGWLAQREEILAFCQAGPHDGGAGALLVLMRAQNASRD
ncbi:Smr/MutS family protein [Thauera sinica]|uniref:Smr/MutS family protein n=1 Tax=Thauera sinica TaxID=2665146 RepID=A0ABW1AX14_9RHOO|nr:Smr/MutS family protein [Thauera sp. K11]ATE60274.1 DNA mismatch repair protein MutS [Thauera sp. K11]